MKAVKEINIYLLKKRNAQNIDVVQYDTGIQLVFNVLDFEIPAGTTATLYVQKPSGKFVYQQQNISVVDNTIVIALENQAITEHGRTPYQITLTNGNDEISTFSGVLCVEKSLKNAGAVESKTVIKAFDEVVAAKIAEFQNRAETAANAVIATLPDDYTTLSAKVNEFANSIKGHLSGAVVTADDVSPVEHSLKVWAHGKNLFNINNFKVYSVIENTVNSIEVNGNTASLTSDLESGFYVPIYLQKNKTYKFTGSFENITNIRLFIDGAFSIDNTVELLVNAFTESGQLNFECVAKKSGVFNLRFWVAQTTATVTEIMVCEKGAIATEYEPWQDTTTATITDGNSNTYTPNADGTITGISSTVLASGISTDTDGVIIECEYIKDTNKVIAKIADALNITI